MGATRIVPAATGCQAALTPAPRRMHNPTPPPMDPAPRRRPPVAAAAALWLLSLAAGLWVAPRGLVYWDSFSYVAQSVDGRAGGLMLGRPAFVLASHALSRLALSLGASPWSLSTLLSLAWLCVSALAAPFIASLSRALGLSRRASLLAGALLALSPAFAHTAGALLTDAPSLALTLAAFATMASAGSSPSPASRAAMAGALLGLSVGRRGQAVTQSLTLAWMALRLPREQRAKALAAGAVSLSLVAVAPPLWFALTQRGYVEQVRAWSGAMARERAEHPYTLRDLMAFAMWLPTLGPVALAGAVAGWARRDALAPALRPVTVLGAVQLCALALYQDISYSPRYLLPALPGALILPAAVALDRWVQTSAAPPRRGVEPGAIDGEDRVHPAARGCRGGVHRVHPAARGRRGGVHRAWTLVALALLPVLLAGPFLRVRERPLREAIEELPSRLRAVPDDAVIVTGQACPAVSMTRRLARVPGAWEGAPPRWTLLCPGWGWPLNPEERLDAALAEGRTVVIDLRPGAWLGPRQGAVRDVVARWASAREGRVVRWR